MFALKKLLSTLILPPTSLILLTLFGLWLARRHPRMGRGLTLVALLALLVLSVPWVGNRLLQTLEPYPVISAEALGKVDAIVVLGGGAYPGAPEYGGDTVNHFSLERIRYAAHLYRQHKQPILVTGGAPASGIAEGVLMRAVLEKELATPARWVESTSLDTAGNARYSAVMLKQAGVQRIALVSHAWHLPRAVPLFEAQGLTVVPAPTQFTGNNTRLIDFVPGNGLKNSRYALHEWLGIAAHTLMAPH